MWARNPDSGIRIFRIEFGEKLRCGQAGGRHAEIGSDFGERDKDEGALGKAEMRDYEAGFGQDEIAIEEDIEVEGARTVEDGARAITAEQALDREKSFKEGARREIGLNGDDGVQEARLIGKADGLGGIERGTRGDAAERGDLLESSGEGSIGRASGAWEVGAEGDVDEGHGDKGSK